eukprot:scpid103515/ scgid17963/ 
MSCRESESAEQGRRCLRPKGRGRGRVRAQFSHKVVVGDEGASTEEKASVCGRVTRTPTEQPATDQECSSSPLSTSGLDKVSSSHSRPLESASLPSSGSSSPQARKDPSSYQFAELQSALLGMVAEVDLHATNQTLQRDQSNLFSDQVQMVPKPATTKISSC